MSCEVCGDPRWVSRCYLACGKPLPSPEHCRRCRRHRNYWGCTPKQCRDRSVLCVKCGHDRIEHGCRTDKCENPAMLALMERCEPPPEVWRAWEKHT